MKRFHLHAVSGLVAASAADSVLFAWRNPGVNVQWIERIHVKWRTTTGPTAAQEIAIQANYCSLFGVNFTDGSDLSDPATAGNYAVRNTSLDLQRVTTLLQTPVSQLASGNVRIATTAGLTAGATAPTVEAHPWAWDSFAERAAAATVPLGFAEFIWEPPVARMDHDDPQKGCWPLRPDTGFIVRLPIATVVMVGRVSVGVDWLE